VAHPAATPSSGLAGRRENAWVRIQSVTVGVPCADLPRSVAWYLRVFELEAPDLEPAPGVAEFKLGPIWLQLGQEPTLRTGAEVVVRFGVIDAEAERIRLMALGVPVGEVRQVESELEYFEFSDPDGNRLSMYAEVEP